MTLRSTPSLDITWRQPTFLLPLFCLCSLLGSTDSLAAAMGMAVIVMIATSLFSIWVSLFLRVLPQLSSPAIWLLCSSTLIALIELLLHATFYNLYRKLGLFLPLSIISCLLLARQEMQTHTSIVRNLQRALLMSAGYALAAVVLGVGRELVGHGSLLADAGNLLGAWAKPFEWQLFRADMGFLLAILAPGAFVALGLGVALYNWLWLHIKARNLHMNDPT